MEIPSQLKRVLPTDAGTSNDTYCLIDAVNATQSLRTAPRRPATDYRIAFLGGGQLEKDLGQDAVVARISETEWRSQLQGGCFDFLLLEPVWTASGDDWRYAFIRGERGNDELRLLLEHCRAIGLPAVLWFREDVRNYADFSWLGGLVETAYGISDSITRQLERDYGRGATGTLAPAVQPAVDNPMRTYALQEAAGHFGDRVLFDGWWELARHPAARSLVAALRQHGVLICESRWDFGGVRLGDLPELASSVVGCVDEQGKAVLNKLVSAEVFASDGFRLDWQRQQSMMRAAACGSLVATVFDSPEGRLSPEVAWRGNEAGLMAWLNDLKGKPLAAITLSQKIRRELLTAHTIAHRLDRIAIDLGLPQRNPQVATVAMVLVTMRPQLLKQSLDRYRRDLYSNKELLVVLHGDHDLGAARKLVRPGEKIKFMQIGSERSLGACLNRAIDAIDSDYWAKVDDDDLYGPNYLTDLMLGRQLVDYSIAGKPPMFAYLEESDSLYFDPVWAAEAHVWHDPHEAKAALVAGGTLVGKRELLDDVRFCERRRGGSDSDFIRRCYERGHGLAALDGFNFVRYRSAAEGFHTWRMNEDDLVDRARRIGSISSVESTVFV